MPITVTGLNNGTSYTFTVDGDQRSWGSSAAVGAVEHGDTGDRAGSPERGERRRQQRERDGQLHAALDNGGIDITGYTVTLASRPAGCTATPAPSARSIP